MSKLSARRALPVAHGWAGGQTEEFAGAGLGHVRRVETEVKPMGSFETDRTARVLDFLSAKARRAEGTSFVAFIMVVTIDAHKIGGTDVSSTVDCNTLHPQRSHAVAPGAMYKSQRQSSSAATIAECIHLLQSSSTNCAAECDTMIAQDVSIINVSAEAVGTVAWERGGSPRGQAEWIMPVKSCDNKRRLVYIHGGSFQRYSPSHPIYRSWGSRIAIATGLPVLMIDYNLAPENPAPAALHDVLGAVEYAWDHGPHGPESAQQVILGGDSAGGGLVFASLAASLLGEVAPGVAAMPTPSGQERRLPSALWGHCPWTDLTCSQASYESRAWDELNRRGDPIYRSSFERSIQASSAGATSKASTCPPPHLLTV